MVATLKQHLSRALEELVKERDRSKRYKKRCLRLLRDIKELQGREVEFENQVRYLESQIAELRTREWVDPSTTMHQEIPKSEEEFDDEDDLDINTDSLSIAEVEAAAEGFHQEMSSPEGVLSLEEDEEEEVSVELSSFQTADAEEKTADAEESETTDDEESEMRATTGSSPTKEEEIPESVYASQFVESSDLESQELIAGSTSSSSSSYVAPDEESAERAIEHVEESGSLSQEFAEMQELEVAEKPQVDPSVPIQESENDGISMDIRSLMQQSHLASLSLVEVSEFSDYLNHALQQKRIRLKKNFSDSFVEVHSVGKLDPTPCLWAHLDSEELPEITPKPKRKVFQEMGLKPPAIIFHDASNRFEPQVGHEKDQAETQSLRMVINFLNNKSLQNDLKPLYDFHTRTFSQDKVGFRLLTREEMIWAGLYQLEDEEWLHENFLEGSLQSRKSFFRAYQHTPK
ncbi:hypothetical protein [Okeania sp. SIO1H5]|uniref:hypothetical protein n=1 Tax=Okeania sp. SIO1H5 TaxID=2607777 RepID=UPI00257C03AB|nr:hypothetical protein [Okeania sp. SIO1H5]